MRRVRSPLLARPRAAARHSGVDSGVIGRRSTGIATSLLAGLVVACAGGGSEGGGGTGGGGGPIQASPGDTVGQLELAAMSLDSFILHGTLPVPAGTYPRSDGRVPFVVLDPDRNLSEVQVEVVSRYADENQGADVVEVLARVARPAGSLPGQRITYDVVYGPRAPAAFVPDPDVDALLAAPGSLTLRTRDVFANAYSTDLYADARTGGPSLRVLRSGPLAAQVATHQSLMPETPTAGPTGTLPHLMGAHAYVTRWAGEPFFSLDLRIHSAHSGLDASTTVDDPMGKVYFESLELAIPAGWTLLNAFPDPFEGAPYAQGASTVWPFVAPIAGGKLHVMPVMSQFHRRFVVAKAGSEARALAYLREEGLAFCKEGLSPAIDQLWSWWNPWTARYFPQRHRLPNLDHVGLGNLRYLDQQELNARSAQVANGSTGGWPTQSVGMGWCHPWGTNDGGMVSGLEIHLYEGVTTACAGSTPGYRLSQLVHRMVTDRQPNVLFDADGRHTRISEWVVDDPDGDYMPIWWYGGPILWASDPFGITSAPLFQVNAVIALGRQPDWEADLIGYAAIDQAHLIRYTRNAKVLAWLGNDALAKDDLRAQAEGALLGYGPLPQSSWGPGSGVSTGMWDARNYVDAHPGWGFSYGRDQGWGLDAMCAAYSTSDLAWRHEVRPWFDQVIDLLEDGQMACTGIIESRPLSNVFNGLYRCRQSIEAAIAENAIVSMRESVFAGASPTRVAQTNGVLERALYAMISPLVWSSANHGPWAMIAVGLFDENQPPYCTYFPADGNYGWIDGALPWSSFAYAYEVTGNGQFLNKAAEMLGGGNLAAEMQALGAQGIQNNAALLALAQQL